MYFEEEEINSYPNYEIEDENSHYNDSSSMMSNESEMKIQPFEDLKVTIMTVIVTLSGYINTSLAFWLLPITRIEIEKKRKSSKCELPHCKIPGSILSMRHKNNTRGIIRTDSRPFKNAVTIDISTTKKNINLKLSPCSIHMCGASSLEDGIEAATHIINHLRKIQTLINKIQSDKQAADDMIQWVKNATRGTETEKPIIEVKECVNITLEIIRTVKDYSIVIPDMAIPDNFDKDVVLFLLSSADDFIYHSDFCMKLDFIAKIKTVIYENLEIANVHKAMVNYNYSLGFKINRNMLNELIDGQNGFISRYDNALVNSVTIELPYTPLDNIPVKRRKNKVPHHTFLCYRSGAITQSGPGGELMRDAYYLFMNTISRIRKFIEYNPDNEKIENAQKEADASHVVLNIIPSPKVILNIIPSQ